jgi:aminomuconate-semialdehyde/2-hydroxymuconate-6-semialdehyde dehydrogenase
VVTLAAFDNDEEAVRLANAGDTASRPRVDARPRSRPSRRRAAAHRHGLDQHLADARPAHAVRRHRRFRLGREGGMEAMRFFTEPKNVASPWSTPR